MSSAGMAAQFTFTKDRLAREERRCSARATSSLPVPLSPVTSTVAGVGATFSSCAKSRAIGALSPII